MKKIISVVCALAVAATLSVTAFAASGTPSEIYGDPSATTSEGASHMLQSAASSLIESYAATGVVDEPTALYIVDTLRSNESVKVDMNVTEAMRAVLYAGINNKSSAQTVTDDATVIYSNNASLSDVSVSTSGSTITVEASYVNNMQSKFGAMVIVRIPTSQVSSTGYTWTCGTQTGEVIVYPASGDTTAVMFYAPHFSTYTLTPKSETANPSNPSTNNPIKATGADMSLSMLALAVGGIAVISGAAVATKKFNLGK